MAKQMLLDLPLCHCDDRLTMVRNLSRLKKKRDILAKFKSLGGKYESAFLKFMIAEFIFPPPLQNRRFHLNDNRIISPIVVSSFYLWNMLRYGSGVRVVSCHGCRLYTGVHLFTTVNSKQGRIHGNPVAEDWAGAIM